MPKSSFKKLCMNVCNNNDPRNASATMPEVSKEALNELRAKASALKLRPAADDRGGTRRRGRGLRGGPVRRLWKGPARAKVQGRRARGAELADVVSSVFCSSLCPLSQNLFPGVRVSDFHQTSS